MFYSLKRILLLGGLNHAPAIWLERYSNLLRLLSSRLGKTQSARMWFFCCCNSWRLFFLRRLRTYASGAYFIRHHIFMLFWSHLSSHGASFRSSLGALRAPPGVRGPLFAAQIRGCCIFHNIINKYGDHIFCAGCVDPHPLAFPCAAAASSLR